MDVLDTTAPVRPVDAATARAARRSEAACSHVFRTFSSLPHEWCRCCGALRMHMNDGRIRTYRVIDKRRCANNSITGGEAVP